MSNRGKYEAKKIKIDPRLIEDPRLVNTMPKSAGAKKMYSQANSKQPFTIPKKDQVQEITTRLDVNSVEFRQEVDTFLKQTFYFEECNSKLSVDACYLISNPELKQQFLAKKQDMLEWGRKEKELAESFAFFNVRDYKEAKKIAAEGIKVGNQSVTSLGDPALGVCLQRHIDLTFKDVPSRRHSFIIVMFKIMKGHVKQVAVQQKLEPTPNFDCHILKPPDKFKSLDYHHLHKYTQLYLYEYDEEDEIKSTPRHILPYAILQVHFNSDFPALRGNSSFGGQGDAEKSSAPPLGSGSQVPPLRHTLPIFQVYTGDLEADNHHLGRIRLGSYFTQYRPAVFPGPITISRCSPQTEVEQFLGGLKRINCLRESNGRNLSALYYFMEPLDEKQPRFKKFLNYLQTNRLVALGIVNDLMDVLVIPPGEVAKGLGLKSDTPTMLHCIFLTAQSFGEKFAKKRDMRVVRINNNKACPLPMENLSWGLKETRRYCTHHLSEKCKANYSEGFGYNPTMTHRTQADVKDPRLKPRMMNRSPSPRQDSEDNFKTTDMVLSTPEKNLKRSMPELESAQCKRPLINPPLPLEAYQPPLPPEERNVGRNHSPLTPQFSPPHSEVPKPPAMPPIPAPPLPTTAPPQPPLPTSPPPTSLSPPVPPPPEELPPSTPPLPASFLPPIPLPPMSFLQPINPPPMSFSQSVPPPPRSFSQPDPPPPKSLPQSDPPLPKSLPQPDPPPPMSFPQSIPPPPVTLPQPVPSLPPTSVRPTAADTKFPPSAGASTAGNSSQAPELQQKAPLSVETIQDLIRGLASRSKASPPLLSEPKKRSFFEALVASVSDRTAASPGPDQNCNQKEMEEKAPGSTEFKSYEEVFQSHISNFNESLLPLEKDILGNFFVCSKAGALIEGLPVKRVELEEEENRMLKDFDRDPEMLDLINTYCAVDNIATPSPFLPSSSPAGDVPDNKGNLQQIFLSLCKSINNQEEPSSSS